MLEYSSLVVEELVVAKVVVQEEEMWMQMRQGRHQVTLVVCLLQPLKVAKVVKLLKVTVGDCPKQNFEVDKTLYEEKQWALPEMARDAARRAAGGALELHWILFE